MGLPSASEGGIPQAWVQVRGPPEMLLELRVGFDKALTVGLTYNLVLCCGHSTRTQYGAQCCHVKILVPTISRPSLNGAARFSCLLAMTSPKSTCASCPSPLTLLGLGRPSSAGGLPDSMQDCLVLSREWGNGLWRLLLGIIHSPIPY